MTLDQFALRRLRRRVEDRPPWSSTAAWVVGAFAAWVVLARVMPKGLPPGIVALGVIYGSFYALLGIGIVLVYRANRVVNFAQAQLGVIAAVLAIEFVLAWHWNWFLAVFAGLVLSAVLGAVINAVIIRRFRRSSRLILSVATIGLAQVLAGFSQLIPLQFCNPARNASCLTNVQHETFSVPLTAHFSIRPVIFSGNDIVAVIGVAILVGLLIGFLHWSAYGTAIRAAAENGDRAVLLGVPVPRLDTIVWAAAAVLSAAAVLLRVPVLGFAGFATVTGVGNDLLLRTLAVAVIGRMDSLPRTAVAAIGIGIFESLATWTYSNTVYVDASLVIVIVVALLVQKNAFARVVEGGTSTWRAVAEVRPIPFELAHLPEVRWAVRAGKVLLLVVALGIPAVLATSQVYLAALVVVYCMVGLSLLVLTGWTGQISLGQFGLAGLGGATTALLYQRHGWSFPLAVLAGVLAGAAAAFIIGLPALRIQGPFLAVTTLAFGVSASTYLLEPHYLKWFVQEQVNRPTFNGHQVLAQDWQIYYFCLAGFALALFAVRSLRRSRTGRALIAIRDNEAAAQAAGINTTWLKLVAFLISGAIAGLAGSIFVIHQRGVNAGSFSADIDIALFSMVVIGGLGSMPGVVLGAIYVWSAQYFLHGGWTFIASGAGILILLMFLPEGLGGLVYLGRDALLRQVAKRRRIIVPSLLADAAEPEPPPPAEPEPVLTGATPR